MANDTSVAALNSEFTPESIVYDTYVSAANADFTPVGDIPVQMIVANPNLFSPAVQWSNGKARIVNTAQFTLNPGESTFYFIGGMPAVKSLPTTYDFRPGDSISIQLAVAWNTDHPFNWTRRAFVQLFLGTDPPQTDSSVLPYRITRPSWLAPTDIWQSRGSKDAPSFTIPDNRIFTIVRKRFDTASDSVVSARRGGVVAAMDTNLGNSQRVNWTHSINLAVSGAPGPYTGTEAGAYPAKSLSNDDINRASNTIPCALFEANEIQEGVYGMPDTAPQYTAWYEARKRKYADPTLNSLGIPYRDFGTYGGTANYNGDPWNYQVPGGGNTLPNDALFKSKILSVDGARQTCNYFSILKDKGVGAIIKHYADTPDYASRYYNKAFAAEVMAKGMDETRPGIAPAKLIYLDWGKIEALDSNDGNLHTGYLYNRTVGSLGTLKTDRHPQVDYDWQVGNIFCIGFCRTIGYMVFDVRSQYDQFGTNPNEVKAGDPNAPVGTWTWQPKVANTPAPITSAGYPTEPCRWHDAGFEAAYYYAQCARTEGTPWLYCRYQFKDTGV
ncbi:MAG: hypothetical protein J0I82_18080, partial [Spirosoma sp.]|uniref:hypothetical protein n=1 Tax=Spirosoma sp. TaxID=1899569 RepID=UPI001ACC2D04